MQQKQTTPFPSTATAASPFLAQGFSKLLLIVNVCTNNISETAKLQWCCFVCKGETCTIINQTISFFYFNMQPKHTPIQAVVL